MTARMPDELFTAAMEEMRIAGDTIVHQEYLLISLADAAPLQRRGITRDALRSRVREIVGPVQVIGSLGGMNETTSRVLNRAKARATSREADLATREDVLLELLDESDGPELAPAVLSSMGVDVESLRLELQGSN